MNLQDITITYDKKKDRLTFSRPTFQEIYPKNTGTEYLTIMPQKYGLFARVSRTNTDIEVLNLPGDYDIDYIGSYLASKFFNSLIDNESGTRNGKIIEEALLKTGIWGRRGFLVNSHLFPKKFVEKIPLNYISHGNIKDARIWYKAAFRNHPAFVLMDDEHWKQAVSQGSFPAHINQIKGWEKFSYRSLGYIIREKAWKKPNWGLFVSQYHKRHSSILHVHAIAWSEINSYVDVALKFSQSQKIFSIIESIYNAGGKVAALLEMKNIDEAEKYSLNIEREVQNAKNKVLEHYQPPNTLLLNGWAWADKETFWTLGNLYDCCISNTSYYSEYLAKNTAAVACRPNFNKDSGDLGALCFYILDTRSNKWEIEEIRGWNNSDVSPDYLQIAESFLPHMNKEIIKT